MNDFINSNNGLAFSYAAGYPPSLQVASSVFISPICYAASWPHVVGAVRKSRQMLSPKANTSIEMSNGHPSRW